jgi:hypothetical protein
MIKEASTKECRTLPCSVVLAELLPCDPVDLLSWNPLLVADASPAGFTRPEEEVDPMEFRRSTRFRRTSRRRWHCISRRRHRSSSVSVGSELVRSSGSSAASDGSASRSPSKEETEQTEAMEEERAKRGRLASVPKRPPRDRPRLSSMSSDSPPAASSRGAPAPPNAPRKSLDAITKLRTHGTHYREQQEKLRHNQEAIRLGGGQQDQHSPDSSLPTRPRTRMPAEPSKNQRTDPLREKTTKERTAKQQQWARNETIGGRAESEEDTAENERRKGGGEGGRRGNQIGEKGTWLPCIVI